MLEPLERAVEELSKLPGIGEKTARRLALYTLKQDKSWVEMLSKSLTDLKDKITFCPECFNLSERGALCPICSNPGRDNTQICVVEQASDVLSLERTNEFRGVYHVLGGVLSPLSGVGPENIKIKELTERVKKQNVKEVIFALNPDTEGETTCLFIARLLKELNIKISRLARGIPVGSSIEFLDEATIGRAVINRISF